MVAVARNMKLPYDDNDDNGNIETQASEVTRKTDQISINKLLSERDKTFLTIDPRGSDSQIMPNSIKTDLIEPKVSNRYQNLPSID